LTTKAKAAAIATLVTLPALQACATTINTEQKDAVCAAA